MPHKATNNPVVMEMEVLHQQCIEETDLFCQNTGNVQVYEIEVKWSFLLLAFSFRKYDVTDVKYSQGSSNHALLNLPFRFKSNVLIA